MLYLQVTYFKKINMNATNVWCPEILKTLTSYYIPYSKWHGRLELTTETCKFLALKEQAMVDYLGNYALGDEYEPYQRLTPQ